MTVKVWTNDEFHDELKKFAHRDGDGVDQTIAEYIEAVQALAVKAHDRGDGVAIYVNNDLGDPDVGQWQVVSYGGRQAQLETTGAIVGTDPLLNRFVDGDLAKGEEVNQIPKTLPDIGGAINWRYLLEAIVPSPKPCMAVYYEEGSRFAKVDHDRLVAVTVKVTGGATEEEASAIVRAVLDNGLGLWNETCGAAGFNDQDDTGIDTYDRGIRAEVIDAAAI